MSRKNAPKENTPLPTVLLHHSFVQFHWMILTLPPLFDLLAGRVCLLSVQHSAKALLRKQLHNGPGLFQWYMA